MPRVLTIYYKHKPGGFCKRLKMKIEAYLEQEWEVHYIAVEPFPYTHPNLIPHILPTPFKNHESLLFWAYFFLMAPGYALWVTKIEKIQLLSIFSLLYAALSAPARWITGIPLLTFIRTLKEKKKYSTSMINFRIGRILDKIGFIASDSLVANSESIKKELIKSEQTNKDIQILYNHIEEQSFDKQVQRKKIINELGLPENSFILVTTGLLIPRKNLHCLLKAFSAVKEDHLVLIIIGEGPLLVPLQNFAKELMIREKLFFIGWRDNVMEILAGCDLFVFTSYLEGLSNSILDAIACDLPCLVSDISENVEAIQNPEQHFPYDNPEYLSEKISRAVKDQDFYLNLVKNTQENKRRFIFDWKNEMVKKAAKFLKDP
ncbi:MAG: glycosyltransferase family 4 protein [Nitrospinae bacterium]|nr:glycosyltransferase family 4 protein [Nitrospinota bacterium]